MEVKNVVGESNKYSQELNAANPLLSPRTSPSQEGIILSFCFLMSLESCCWPLLTHIFVGKEEILQRIKRFPILAWVWKKIETIVLMTSLGNNSPLQSGD